MPRCYVLPGLLSSEIRAASGSHVALWADPVQIGLGTTGGLRLAPDGLSPGPPDGRNTIVGDPLPDYWAEPIATLSDQLRTHGVTVQAYPYDWRKSIRFLGPALAAQIRADVTPDDPCAIVAHSYGGLVARAAWYDLVLSEDTGLVRRIVTLGTPHQGSYETTLTLGVSDEGMEQILTLNHTVANGFSLAPGVNPTTYMTADKLTRIVATWPALYDLLPLVGSTDADSDPLRVQLYDSTVWAPGGHPSQALLDQSYSIIGPMLRNPDSMPPSWVLTTMAGTGISTRSRLEDPSKLGTAAACSQTSEGDGSVTARSALVPLSVRYTAMIRHSDLQRQLIALGTVAEAVLDPRGPPTPIPPPVTSTDPLMPEFTGPPFQSRLNSTPGGPLCASGRCNC